MMSMREVIMLNSNEHVTLCRLRLSADFPPCDVIDHGRVTLRRGLPGDIPYGNDTGCKRPPCDVSHGRARRARLPTDVP